MFYPTVGPQMLLSGVRKREVVNLSRCLFEFSKPTKFVGSSIHLRVLRACQRQIYHHHFDYFATKFVRVHTKIRASNEQQRDSKKSTPLLCSLPLWVANANHQYYRKCAPPLERGRRLCSLRAKRNRLNYLDGEVI